MIPNSEPILPIILGLLMNGSHWSRRVSIILQVKLTDGVIILSLSRPILSDTQHLRQRYYEFWFRLFTLDVPENDIVLSKVNRKFVVYRLSVKIDAYYSCYCFFIYLQAVRWIQAVIFFVFFLLCCSQFMSLILTLVSSTAFLNPFQSSLHLLFLYFEIKWINLIRGQSLPIHAYDDIKNAEPMITIFTSSTAEHKSAFICF